MDSARHVIGCHLTQESRVQNAFYDAASTIHQSLPRGVLAHHERGGEGWAQAQQRLTAVHHSLAASAKTKHGQPVVNLGST